MLKLKIEKLFRLKILGLTLALVSPFLLAQHIAAASATSLTSKPGTTETSSNWIDHRFHVMGTEARVRLWHQDSEIGAKALAAVIAEMHRIDTVMSSYKQDSLLAKVNRLASTQAVKITKELFDIIQQSFEISNMTHGAFDISYSSVGYLYDYRKNQQPNAEQIKTHLKLINYQQIKLDQQQQSIRFLQPGMRIDLGGIAKGLAVDNSIAILRKYGVKEALVTAGGDTYALGDNGGKLWQVGIKHPRAESKIVTLLPVENEAVSTSGDYERFFLDGTTRVHHIINPKTGTSASEVQSVTIIAANSTFADALSTSVFVLGVEKGLALVEALDNVSVIIVDNKGKLFYSSDLISAN
jgi:thiamine biosynthesis lipoprotein